MPMDPFFTSKGEDPRSTGDFQHGRAKAWAKAIQFRRFAANLPIPHQKNALAKHLKGVNDPENCARVYHHNKVQAAGRPSLTGFKAPKKTWRHRNSQHPK